ncbi:MAG TPA: DUF202 domain-containing protein [Dissulfurispiraceae bacterium]|nr:DUF202 domain-containing protein [Dissulfurispiraceae bacterium]
MFDNKFSRLIRQGLITEKDLLIITNESSAAGKYPEEIFLSKGIPKHEILFCLTEYYGYPFLEYDEDIMVSSKIVRMLDLQTQKKLLWLPLYFDNNQAEVVAYNPDESTAAGIKETLNVKSINFLVALPSDIIRLIENNLDLNPGFDVAAARTPLAKVRTFLSERRSVLACYRTSLAKGRTGLAFIRTGISFITISIVLFRIFGIGYSTIVEAALLIAGILISGDGLLWYLPARQTGKKVPDCSTTQPTENSTVLTMSNPGNNPCFARTKPVEGADEDRADWSNLSPVKRRRFLACDRTDMAEERTTLACHRTLMARGRNGLAFTRTGVAFGGLGIVLLRQFPAGGWTVFDIALILTGILMALEGFYWYLPGRRSGIKCAESVMEAEKKISIWDVVFPPVHKRTNFTDLHAHMPPVRQSHSRGIWATTGLALERTMLADRRNVMARLRTTMARSRTGLAIIRTGMSLAAVGIALLAYYGPAVIPWTVFYCILIAAGTLLIADGIYWYAPAEKVRRQFPYCLGEMEILIPDYGKPVYTWEKVIFDDDDLD